MNTQEQEALMEDLKGLIKGYKLGHTLLITTHENGEVTCVQHFKEIGEPLNPLVMAVSDWLDSKRKKQITENN